jgi:hypothetical protein
VLTYKSASQTRPRKLEKSNHQFLQSWNWLQLTNCLEQILEKLIVFHIFYKYVSECSLPCSKSPWHLVTRWLLSRRVISLRPNQVRGPSFVGCPRLIIQDVCSYPPYMEAVSSILSLSTHNVVVTRDPLTTVFSLLILVTAHRLLYLVPAKLRGGQNKFSSPPFPFETRGNIITTCPANIAALSPSVFDAVSFGINKVNQHHCSLQPRF